MPAALREFALIRSMPVVFPALPRRSRQGDVFAIGSLSCPYSICCMLYVHYEVSSFTFDRFSERSDVGMIEAAVIAPDTHTNAVSDAKSQMQC